MNHSPPTPSGITGLGDWKRDATARGGGTGITGRHARGIEIIGPIGFPTT